MEVRRVRDKLNIYTKKNKNVDIIHRCNCFVFYRFPAACMFGAAGCCSETALSDRTLLSQEAPQHLMVTQRLRRMHTPKLPKHADISPQIVKMNPELACTKSLKSHIIFFYFLNNFLYRG